MNEQTYCPIREQPRVVIAIKVRDNLNIQAPQQNVWELKTRNEMGGFWMDVVSLFQTYLPSSFNAVEVTFEWAGQKPKLGEAKLIRSFNGWVPHIDYGFCTIIVLPLDIHNSMLQGKGKLLHLFLDTCYRIWSYTCVCVCVCVYRRT